jgi:DNA-directed RNA polymerase specialized sigma24 family protein
MAAGASFEEFYAATVDRLLGHLFLVTGLVQALGSLPVRQRQAIVLHYLADLPVAEIAQALAVPSGTVKSLLARGRRALAAKLGEPEEVFDRA